MNSFKYEFKKKYDFEQYWYTIVLLFQIHSTVRRVQNVVVCDKTSNHSMKSKISRLHGNKLTKVHSSK